MLSQTVFLIYLLFYSGKYKKKKEEEIQFTESVVTINHDVMALMAHESMSCVPVLIDETLLSAYVC